MNIILIQLKCIQIMEKILYHVFKTISVLPFAELIVNKKSENV